MFQLALLAITFLFATASQGQTWSGGAETSIEGLNTAAHAAHKLYFGMATRMEEMNDTTYVAILDDFRTFGQLTPARVMKWVYTEPERGMFTLEEGDRFVAFASGRNKLIRGHNCVWYQELPDWVTQTNWTARDLASVVQEHCYNIVHHWQGKIWDVINEPFNDDGTWRETMWYNILNKTYIPLALYAARDADPRAKLYINGYNITGTGQKATAMKNLIRDLKRSGVPIDGVGVEAHEVVGQVPSLADIRRNLEEVVSLGVEVAITELDIRFPSLPPDAAGLEQQKRDFETIVRACAEVERCIGITVWDFTDKYSWVPGTFPGMGDACPWDSNLMRKPAYYGILDGLKAFAP